MDLTVAEASFDLIVDVAGYFVGGVASAGGAFVSTAPSRILDTRTGTGASAGMVAPQGEVMLQVTGRAGVPAVNVSAVVMNVTVTNPQRDGYVMVYPTKESLPNASNLNFLAGQTVPNLVTVKIGDQGQVSLLNASAGSAHLIADVAGYYLAG